VILSVAPASTGLPWNMYATGASGDYLPGNG
jgi:hypothetical protein